MLRFMTLEKIQDIAFILENKLKSNGREKGIKK